MKAIVVACYLGLISQTVMASDRWLFAEKMAVTEKPVTGVFQHLEGAGRKHIAVSSGSIAVVWEDDRSGNPQVYVARKSPQQEQFSNALRVSSGMEAYEPAIAGLSGHRFMLAWEQDGAVFVRLLFKDNLSEPIKLSKALASHATLAAMDDALSIAWREQQGPDWSLKVAYMRVNVSNQITLDRIESVETQRLKTPVLFPALALNRAGLCVAWEDRRAGHTRLLVSYSNDQGQSFSQPQSLNEYYSNRNEYDKGNGVTRVSLAAFAEDEVIAAWMDKRRGGAGYGIFASIGAEGGESFGPNEKVHGRKGDQQPHYNPSVAGNRSGEFVVAWDDFRNGDSDIWLSGYNEDDEWSQDYSPGVASGPGEQSHPSITLDEQGGLHLLWMERASLNEPGRLWYSAGHPQSSD